MRIVDKVQFILGIFDIIVGIALTIAAIILHRYTKIVFTLFPVGMGIMTLIREIETRNQKAEAGKGRAHKSTSEIARITPDDTGHVHCYECPLHFGDPNRWDFRCKANCKYDPKTNDYEWEDSK